MNKSKLRTHAEIPISYHSGGPFGNSHVPSSSETLAEKDPLGQEIGRGFLYEKRKPPTKMHTQSQ